MGRRAGAGRCTAGVRSERRALRLATTTTSPPQNPDDSGSRAITRHEPGARRRVRTRRDDAERLRELRRGLRDADVRRARLPHRRRPASTSSCSPRRAARPKSASSTEFAQRPAAERGACSTIDTPNEIVVDAATGGRTTFKNARRDARAAASKATWDGRFGDGLQRARRAHVAARRIRRCVHDRRAAGRRAGGHAAARRAVEAARMASSHGCPAAGRGLDTALEVQYVDKLYVNERNTDAAPAYAVANVRVGFAQRRGRGDVARVRARQQRRSIATTSGSVIVGDTQRTFFRAGAGPQLVCRRRRRMSGSDRAARATRAPRSCCTGWSPRW